MCENTPREQIGGTMSQEPLRLHLRRQELARDEGGHAYWQVVTQTESRPAGEVAIVICDVWDSHWSRGAAERVDALAPRIDAVISAARERGAHVIHAPSETMAFYADSPARRRMRDLPAVELPPLRDHPDPPLPIDDSDGGSDTGETSSHKAWSRQHPAIAIDPRRDGISDDGDEIFRHLRHHDIARVLILGVHTNMCILRRSFAIKALVRRGVPVALVRDLTDAMYNPARAPYVSHAEGTRLVVEYVEKFWCPTVESGDLA
jgi:nicotinamidase-related amidase